jgi:hypothetical protein
MAGVVSAFIDLRCPKCRNRIDLVVAGAAAARREEAARWAPVARELVDALSDSIPNPSATLYELTKERDAVNMARALLREAEEGR